MSRAQPDFDDYQQLFRIYGGDLGSIYQEPDDDRYALLFEQMIRLLIQPSPFNLSLPQPFRISARRYHNGDPATTRHLSKPANRHFMLCDLHDMITLKARMALKRRERES